MKKFLAFMLVALLVIPAVFAFSASAETTNVALNKSYTVTGSGYGYENLEGQWPSSYRANLTDGVAESELTYGTTGNWFGFYYSASASETLINAPEGVGAVTVDLGAATTGLVSVRAHLATPEINGIGTPKSVTVALSEDNETFADVGTLQGIAKNEEGYWADLTFDKAYTAQYVRFTFDMNLDQGVFAFLNELEVLQDASQQSSEPETSTPAEPEKIQETISVDGDLSDTGWAEDGWTEVTPENGTVQEAETGDDTLNYKFQMRTDDEKLYIAFIVNCDLVQSASEEKSACTNARLWLHVDNEYDRYTHFYDAWVANDGSTKTAAKYNTAKDANSGAVIENSSIQAAISTGDGQTYIEMSVNISEFAKEDQTEVGFFANVANTVNKQFTLLYPQFPIGEENRNENMPYMKWYTEGEGKIVFEELKLGEIEVGGGDTSEGDTSEGEGEGDDEYEEMIKTNMGPANDNAQFDVELTGPETYKAG
ncbi:MAG: hypothetical protein IK047_00345, partial [Clostridia bacterium]|nr:hypothetical protein [Clostridia bacterium]